MQLRNVIVMLVLAVLCAVGYVALQGATPTATKVRGFSPFKVKDVTSVSASAAGKAFEARRSATASDRWEMRSESGWVRGNSILVEEILGALQRSSLLQYFSEEQLAGESRRAFGLEDPIANLTLAAAGETWTYRIGQMTDDNSAYYADHGPATGVFVVTTEVYSELLGAFQQGLRDMRALDIHTFDIGKVEILRGDKPALVAERDLTHVWSVTVPFDGFADPRKFEEFVRALSGSKVLSWVDDDAQVLSKFGLDAPRARVRVTGRGGRSHTLIVGGDADENVYVMEEDSSSVAVAPKDFKAAVFLDPRRLRDDSFTRVGIGIKEIGVRLDDVSYRLEREQTWDIVEPVRFPADDQSARALSDEIKRWKTLEFLDRADPAKHGINEDRYVSIGQSSGDEVRLLIGDPAPGGGVYAQRRGSRGVERVDDAPLQTMRRGYPQFRRKEVTRNWVFEDLFFIGRSVGTGPSGKKLQMLVLERDLAADNPVWRDSRSGVTGTLDAVRVADIVRTLRGLRAATWLPLSRETRDAWGLDSDRTVTTRIDLQFHEKSGMRPEELQPKILVGKPFDGGGYYACIAGQLEWAFVLPEDVAKILLADVIR